MRKNLSLLFLMPLSLGLSSIGVAAAADLARFQSLEQYTRLQIPASNGSTFRLTNGTNGTATLLIDHVRPGVMDALTSWTDDRVASVSVKSIGVDQAEVTIQFKNAATDSFAYHQGGQVVLDLWRQDKPSATALASPAAGEKSRNPGKKSSSPAKVAKAAPKRTPRLLASLDAVAPPIAILPLSRERDLFQRYTLPMPELRLSSKDPQLALPPDAEIEGLWKFTDGNKATDEGRAYEFVKKLFDQKKYGLALKSIEISRRDYPKSPHADELRFLEALCYRRLGEATTTASLSKKADATLRELANEKNAKGEELPFAQAIRLYFAQKDYVAGNWMEAIPNLEYVAAKAGPAAKEFPYLQMMLAECYGHADDPRRAERIYRYLSEKFPKHVLAKEGTYRKVDLLATAKNYERVAEEGPAALKAYPEHEKDRSEVLFNMGEANFALGRFDQAEKNFRRFAEISSAQTNAALAWVRVGEIRELNKGDLKGAREAYLSAKNGYPFSPGDLTATVRLARIDAATEKEPAFIVKTLQDIIADKSIDEDLRRMAELALGPYLLRTEEGPRALELARQGMAQNDGVAFEAYKKNYLDALYAKLLGLAKAKRYSEAVALYEKERKWFELYGAESFRTMADVYRGLGLYATSNELMEKYAKEAKGRGVASAGGRAALDLSRAKNSFSRGAYKETLGLLPEDDGDADITSMRAISEYRLGRKKVAYGLAAKALALTDQDLAEATTLELMEITLDWNQADGEFARMDRDLATAAKRIKGDNERLLFAQGDAAWYQKKHEVAASAYRTALGKFPKGERADRARYNLGMSLLSVGKREEAVKLLTELRESGKGLWAESAKQELELLGWEKKYSSVLKTLPPTGLGIND
ncbi:MAG: tetratricopeptide repeat protein [Proteobacteria bacterium]|nr:MAG: tetratricopeptide repeat protein [Pseudomonadota bacterium]